MAAEGLVKEGPTHTLFEDCYYQVIYSSSRSLPIINANLNSIPLVVPILISTHYR
jgi:hypothetical protein